MKIRKIFPGICLLALCMTGFLPAAQAALVTSPRQPIILTAGFGSDTSGKLYFADLVQIKSDGTSVPFVLPSNQQLVITYCHFNFTAAVASPPPHVEMRVGPFYSRALAMTNGNSAFIDTFDPGFRINSEGFSGNYFYAVDVRTGSLFPGTVGVRLVGYLASVQ